MYTDLKIESKLAKKDGALYCLRACAISSLIGRISPRLNLEFCQAYDLTRV